MRERLNAIYTAVEFIEARLQDEISVADIAASAGYSLYHFIRIFNQTVHHSPYDYLMRRRLSEAACQLLVGDGRILDIALDFCFHSHETFSRAFKRMFAMQPRQWQSLGAVPRRSLMPRATLAYLEHINQTDFLRPVLVEREALILAGLVTQDRGDLPQLWQSLEQTLRGIPLTRAVGSFYGVTVHSLLPKEASFLLAGVEIESAAGMSPILVVQTIPAGQYACFIHKGTDMALSLTLDYIYHTWLPRSGMRLTHPLEIECFGKTVIPDSDRILYLPTAFLS